MQPSTLPTRRMICETYYSGQDPMTEFEVELRLDEKELVISYEDEDTQGKPLVVIYRGKNTGDGHFELRATGVEGGPPCTGTRSTTCSRAPGLRKVRRACGDCARTCSQRQVAFLRAVDANTRRQPTEKGAVGMPPLRLLRPSLPGTRWSPVPAPGARPSAPASSAAECVTAPRHRSPERG